MANRGQWTIVEANQALVEVRLLLGQARVALTQMRELELQLTDLRIVWGDAVLSPACPGHAEFADFYQGHARQRDVLRLVMLRFHALGIEVKDLDQGLIDFRGEVAGQPAYLCWRDGEEQVQHWHTLEGGFSQRRKLPAGG